MTHPMTAPLRIRRLSPAAILPARADPGSVGYDLRALAACVIPAGCRAVIGTGIAAAIPPGCYGRVASRSGLAARYGLDVLAGVIDPSYRGEIGVVLLNTGFHRVTIQAGDRIAQLVLERCETPPVLEVEALDDTARGDGGFGSTGA